MVNGLKNPSSKSEYEQAVILRQIKLTELIYDQLQQLSEHEPIMVFDHKFKDEPNSRLKSYIGKHEGIIYFEQRFYRRRWFMLNGALRIKILGRLDLTNPKRELSVGVSMFQFGFAVLFTLLMLFNLGFSRQELVWEINRRVIWIFPIILIVIWRHIFMVYFVEKTIQRLLMEVEK